MWIADYPSVSCFVTSLYTFVRFFCLPSGYVRLVRRTKFPFLALLFAFSALPRAISGSSGEQNCHFGLSCSLFLPSLGLCKAQLANKTAFSASLVRFFCLPSGYVRLVRRTKMPFRPLLFAFSAFPRDISGLPGEQNCLFWLFCSLFLPFLGLFPAYQANKTAIFSPFVRFLCLLSGNIRLVRRTKLPFRPLLFAFSAFSRAI